MEMKNKMNITCKDDKPPLQISSLFRWSIDCSTVSHVDEAGSVVLHQISLTKQIRITPLWFMSQSHQSHKITFSTIDNLKITWISLVGTIVLEASSPMLYHPLLINCWGFQSLQWWCRGPSSPGLTWSSSWRRGRRRWSSGRVFLPGSQSCKGIFGRRHSFTH